MKIKNKNKYKECTMTTRIIDINENNDKYKCYCLFYINCFKNNLLPCDIIFKTIDSFNNPIDIKKIKNKSWRNLLYDFERYNTMRKM